MLLAGYRDLGAGPEVAGVHVRGKQMVRIGQHEGSGCHGIARRQQ